MKRLKVYLDTSIISFIFAEDSPEKQEITKEFFGGYIELYDVYISNLVIAEINNTVDAHLKAQLKSVITAYSLKTIHISDDDQEILFYLANSYIKNKIIPRRKFDDAMHIAIAVYYEFDILLSWNFKHLANIKKQMEVNSLNKKEGYNKELYLLNPMEAIYEKD